MTHYLSALMHMPLAQGLLALSTFAVHVLALPCCRQQCPEVPWVMEDPGGPGDKLERLLAERAAMKRQEAKLKAQLKKAKEVVKREERAWRLSTFMLHVVLIAYALCDYKAPAAMKFLTMTGRKRRWPEKPESELEELVEDVFMQCDTNELAGLADKDSSTDPTAFAVAVPYIEEWNMAAFVEDQNVRFGLAPSTESLLDRWRRRRAMYPEAFRPLDPGFVAEAKARKWAHRFRARWGAWHGSIRVRDELPLEETRTKAGPEKRPRGGTKSDPGEAPKGAQWGEAKATRGWQNASPKRAHIASSFWVRLGGECKESS